MSLVFRVVVQSIGQVNCSVKMSVVQLRIWWNGVCALQARNATAAVARQSTIAPSPRAEYPPGRRLRHPFEEANPAQTRRGPVETPRPAAAFPQGPPRRRRPAYQGARGGWGPRERPGA